MTILSALALSKNCLLIEEDKDLDGIIGMKFRGLSRDSDRAMFHSSTNLFISGEKANWKSLKSNL
jgi:hypothetical protein